MSLYKAPLSSLAQILYSFLRITNASLNAVERVMHVMVAVYAQPPNNVTTLICAEVIALLKMDSKIF
jgi:hypothetical protein